MISYSDIKIKYREIPTPAKASLWFLVCNIIQAGLVVITTPIFTRLMSQEEYGYVTAYSSWRSIILIFASLNLSYGVFNNAMAKYEDSKTRDEYISSMQTLYCIITIALYIIYLCGRNSFNDVLGMDTCIVSLMFLDILCYPALLFWSSRQRYEYKYKMLVVVTLIQTGLNVGIGIFAVLLAEQHKDIARIYSMVLVDVLVCGAILIIHFIKGRKFYVSKYWKYALAFNIPLIPHYLSEIVLTQSDRIMISNIVSYSAAAKYGVSYSLVSMVQLVLNAISASFIPWAYESIKKEDFESIKKMANGIMLLICGVVSILLLICPEIILLFAGKSYLEAVYVIPPLAMSVFFIFLYDMFATIEFYHAKTFGIMFASIISASLNVLLNAFFIPKYGYYAAAYTTLFCYSIYAVMHYVFYFRIMRKEHFSQTCFDVKKMGIVGMMLGFFTLIVAITYDNNIVRYIIVVIIVVVMIKEREKIAEIVKSLK